MLSENIRNYRKAKGLSQEELAAKLNVVRQTVSKWEKGLSVPDSEMLILLAEVFEVPVAELLGETVSQEEAPTLQSLAAKLELLNEQFAKKAERSRKVWKTVFIVIGCISAVVLLFPMVLKQDWQLMYFSILLCLLFAIFLTYFTTSREISKYYLCLVHGKLRPAAGELTNYLRRDMDKKQVFVEKRKTADSLTAKLRYLTLESRCDLSLVECELLTGRTHQIRVQMSEAGHPLVGDTKYGTLKQNQGLPFRHQALWSYRLRFDFPTDAGELEYLRGREFQVKAVPFLEYFYQLPKK
jgi:transcriptional regulator with XRE-family HTH domain